MDEKMMEAVALRSAMRTHDDGSGERIFVSSMYDANILLRQHMTPEGARYRRKLVEYIVDPENRVMSECDVYHNFVMDLFDVGDYDLALQVCNHALGSAPYNRDMLGDAIKACGDSSQFEKGEEYLKRAMEIPYKRWSFLLFFYSVDFLKTKLGAYPMDDELYQRAIALADEYIHNHPYDEHGYNQKAELLVMMNEREKAIAELQRYIFDTRPDEMDSKSELITAQCCVTLLNLLDNSNDYDLIIRICDRGLRNTTQEQPSASISFFAYRKALGLDAKALDLDAKKFDASATVAAALKFYQSAYDLNQTRQYGRTIEQRHAVLEPYVKPEDFRPLIRRNLYITQKDGADTTSET